MDSEFVENPEEEGLWKRSVDETVFDSVRQSFKAMNIFSYLSPSKSFHYEALNAEFDNSTSVGAPLLYNRNAYPPISTDLHSETESKSAARHGSFFSEGGSTIQSFNPATRHKSFYLNSATLGSCIINLSSTIVGSGVLSLPYAMSKTGWALGLFLLISIAILSAFSLHLLAACAAKESPASIIAVCRDAGPLYSGFINFTIFVNTFGACLSYLIVIGNLMPQVMSSIGVEDRLWTGRHVWIAIGFAVVFPFCCLEKLDTLKYTSALVLIFSCFTAFMGFIYSLRIKEFDACHDVDEDETCRGETHALSLSLDTVRVVGIFVFAFTGTQNIINVMNELTSPVPRRVHSVVNSSYAFVLVLYSVLACCGYSTYGTKVASNILVSYPYTIGYGMARVFTSLYVGFAFPVQFFPARNAIFSLLDSLSWCRFKDGVSDSVKLSMRHGFVTLGLLFCIFVLALITPDIGELFSFVGLFSIILGYIFPGASFYMMHKEPGTAPAWKRRGAIILVILGCTVIPMALFSSIYRYA